jgi:HIRAN domain
MIPAVERLFVTWQEPESRRIFPIARLLRLRSGGYEFAYIRAVAEARERGFAGLAGLEATDQVYVSADLPDLFANRRPAPRRRGSEPPPTPEPLDAAPITLFVPRSDHSGNERLEVFAPPLPAEDGSYWGVFVVRGVGRLPGSNEIIEALQPQQPMRLRAEPDNAYNPRAVLVLEQGDTSIGYLPDYLANELADLGQAPELLGAQIQSVQRLNYPPAAPLYQVTCRYTCPGELGKRLFRSEQYRPVSARAYPR